MNSLFRRQAPSAADLDSFHQDGYIFYPDVLKDEARRSLTNEILGLDSVRHYLDALDENPPRPSPTSSALGTTAARAATASSTIPLSSRCCKPPSAPTTTSATPPSTSPHAA